MALNPADYAVISQTLIAATHEMGAKLVRSAYSTIVREASDASAALLDPDGQAVAQAELMIQQLGSLSATFGPCAEHHPVDTLVEGDFYINNDPYHGGQHLPDVFIFSPVFFEGELVAFGATVAHHIDIGGGAPGLNVNAREIYQEGLIIPPEPVQPRRRLERRATRTPDRHQRPGHQARIVGLAHNHWNKPTRIHLLAESAPPREQHTGVDGVASRHRRNRILRTVALGDNVSLLRLAPLPPRRVCPTRPNPQLLRSIRHLRSLSLRLVDTTAASNPDRTRSLIPDCPRRRYSPDAYLSSTRVLRRRASPNATTSGTQRSGLVSMLRLNNVLPRDASAVSRK